MRKVTVIGGSGFVGTNLCKRLNENKIHFEIIDLRESQQFSSKCKIADVRKLESLRENITGDIVVHLAAVHRDDVIENNDYYQTNVIGTENVTKVCSERKINKIVFTSTVAVYGFSTPKTDENAEINPFNNYGKSKFQAEQKLREWNVTEGNNLIIIRPTVIFGEGNRGNVFNLFNQIYSGNFIMVGSGQNLKSLAYIDNVVAFIEQCMRSDKKYGLYNYVDTPDLDMNSLVQLVKKTLKGNTNIGLRLPYWVGLMMGYLADVISKVTGKRIPLSSIRIKKFCADTSFLSDKKSMDFFDPPVNLAAGIERTLQREFISPNPNREIFFTE